MHDQEKIRQFSHESLSYNHPDNSAPTDGQLQDEKRRWQHLVSDSMSHYYLEPIQLSSYNALNNRFSQDNLIQSWINPKPRRMFVLKRAANYQWKSKPVDFISKSVISKSCHFSLFFPSTSVLALLQLSFSATFLPVCARRKDRRRW